MAPKRKERVASSPTKKRVRDTAAEKLNQQLKEVDAVLKRAQITPELQQMLSDVLPCSLGQFSDQRHKFQERVVDGVSNIFGEVEAALRKEVADAREKRDAATAEKPRRHAAAAEATEKMKAQEAEVQRLKVALAEKALAFRAASASLVEAETAKKAEGLKAQHAANKNGDFHVALQDLTVLKAASTAEAEARDKGEELMGLLKKYRFEESMMIALPTALAKAPDARGQFDIMAINQLEGEIGKMIAEQEAVLAATKPGQEQCEAAVQAAQERLAGARGEQRTAARTFDAASKDLEKATAASADTQKAVHDAEQVLNRLSKAVYAAEVEEELFEQGPMDIFKCLRERATPVVEEPSAAVEEQATNPPNSEVPVAVAAC